MKNGVPIKVVFRNKNSEWLAVLSTDYTLSDQEIIKIYGIRWDIEVFFKTTKSLLHLQKEFQGYSYDLLISNTTALRLVTFFKNYVMKSMNLIGLSLYYS